MLGQLSNLLVNRVMLNYLFVLRIASGLSPETWIGDSLSLIGNLTLKNITIPGTHDSGAFFLTDIPVPGDDASVWQALSQLATLQNETLVFETKKWARAQDINLYSQLLNGIRYFDLRCAYNSTRNEWITFHFLEGTKVIYLLQNISQFLAEYSKEIVIVEMSHFDGNPTTNNIIDLRNMVLDILGEFLYPVDYSLKFTINQMVNSGKRALVTMDKLYDNITIWSGNVIYNTYANSPDLLEMIEYNNVTVQKFMNGSHESQIFKVSWTLTPNSTTVLNSVEPWYPQTLIELADVGNLALPSYYNSIWKKRWRMGNILIIDYCEKSKIMNVVWKMNGIEREEVEES